MWSVKQCVESSVVKKRGSSSCRVSSSACRPCHRPRVVRRRSSCAEVRSSADCPHTMLSTRSSLLRDRDCCEPRHTRPETPKPRHHILDIIRIEPIELIHSIE